MLWYVVLALLMGAPRVDTRAQSDCARCHAEVFEAWSGSSHGRAHDNPLFNASTAQHHSLWCAQCHSPVRAGAGVTCRACHDGGDGVVLTANEPTRRARRAHRMQVSQTLGSSEQCARCHQFDVPIRRPGEPTRFTSGTPMQNTVAEWEGSAFAARGETCQSCHFTDHTGASSDLTDHLDVRVEMVDDETRVTIATRGIGHAFPTGDPFRQLIVELCADPTCDQPVGRAVFARFFAPDGNGGSTLVRDTTVPAPTTGETAHRTLEVNVATTVRHWRLVYHLTEVDIGDAGHPVLAEGFIAP